MVSGHQFLKKGICSSWSILFLLKTPLSEGEAKLKVTNVPIHHNLTILLHVADGMSKNRSGIADSADLNQTVSSEKYSLKFSQSLHYIFKFP